MEEAMYTKVCKIKIMHFVHGMSTGGAETLVKNYLLNTDLDEDDICLLCLSHEKNSPYEKELSKANIKTIFVQDQLPFRDSSNIIKKIINRLASYFVVKKIIRETAPTILHTHLPINNYVKFSKPHKDMVIFHTIHNDPKKLWPSGNKKRKRDFRAAKWLVEQRGMKFIVLHEDMKKIVDKMFNVSNSIVLNNGVDVGKIKNAGDEANIRKEIKIPSNAFVLGHIGRFSKVKNHSFLIDVFSETVKKNKDAFLLMIGDGPDKNKISEELNKRNLNSNYLILSNRSDIPELLNAMDVFVFPSIYEGLPLSLIEAQIAKKPCFISNSINRDATISNLVTSLPLDDGAEKWANAILNYEHPKKIIVNEDEWDIKKITKQLEQLYINALLEKQNGKK